MLGISTDILSEHDYCIRTGIDFLDRILGGGIYFTRITEIFGTEHCGKTALAILLSHISKCKVYKRIDENNFQRVKGASCLTLYVDNENSLNDTNRVEINGEKLECLVASCDTISHLFNTISDFSNSIQELNTPKEGDDKEKPPVFGLVVVDTIAGICSDEEAQADLGKQDYPRGPKQLRAGFRRISNLIKRSNVAIVCINQVGTNMQSGGGKRRPFQSISADPDDFTSPGGKALKFWSTTRLWMTEYKDYKLRNGSRNSDGKIIEAVVLKCRFATPRRKVRLALSYGTGNKSMNSGGGFDPKLSVLETLILLKLAEINDNKEILFKYNKNGIALPNPTGKKVYDPRIPDRYGWFDYYSANEENVNKLIDKAYDVLLSTGVASDRPVDQVDDDLDDEDIDDDPIPRPVRRSRRTMPELDDDI